MNSKQILLDKFRENKSNRIDASDLRIFVNAVYNEMLLVDNILDRDDVLDDKKVATIKQVSELRISLDALLTQVHTALGTYALSKDIYKNSEVDFKFLSKDEANRDHYKKQEVYSKSELAADYYKKTDVDKALATLEARIATLEGI